MVNNCNHNRLHSDHFDGTGQHQKAVLGKADDDGDNPCKNPESCVQKIFSAIDGEGEMLENI